MKQDSVVKQINRINDSVSSGNKGDIQRKRNQGTGYRPNESRIAISGSRNYRRSKSRRNAASGRKRGGFWISPIALIMSVVVLSGGLGVGIYALWYNSFTDINLADYSEITLSGYNNYGEASLEIAGDSEYSEFFGTVSASLNQDQNLSNGDEVTISYTYNKEMAASQKLRIMGGETAVIVEGLSESVVIGHDDLFQGLKVSFDGMSPCIGVTLENTSEDDFLSQVTYTIAGEKKYFSSGEAVQIEAQVDESLLLDHSYVLDLTDEDYFNEYEAPATDSYITEATEVSGEMLQTLEKAGYELISKADAKEYGLRIFQQEAHLQPVFVGNTTTFKWVNPYVISAYFHSVTEAGKEIPESHANDVQIVYGVTLTQQDGQSVLAEMVIQFVNIVEKEDGTMDLNLDSGRIVSASYRNSNIKKLVSGDSDGVYNTTKLTE